jgi:AcrR family transcriptional regulator
MGDRGIGATRTLDVARAAGVSHGTVFAHFATRDRLIEGAVRRFGQVAAERTHALAQRGTGVREILQAHLECLREHEEFFARLVAEGPALTREARTALIGIQSALALHLTQAAEREGDRIRRLPPHLLFNTWIALVYYYLANRDLFAPGCSVLSKRGGELVEHMMGLLGPGGG